MKNFTLSELRTLEVFLKKQQKELNKELFNINNIIRETDPNEWEVVAHTMTMRDKINERLEYIKELLTELLI